MLFLYRIFIGIYPIAARILGFVNPKAKQWHTGRKEILKQIAAALTSNTKPVIWMHCASLGEFEQGRPVLEGLRKQYPNYSILLTFFSPSGYEVHKNYAGADYVFYLPMDSAGNASKFLKITNPSIAIFVKYEFWHYYLTQLKKLQIPTILIAGIFRKDQLFFKWYGSFYKKLLSCFTAFFVQDKSSQSLMHSIGINNEVYIGGDTRFDRVIEIAAAFTPIDPIAHFCNNSLVLVAGSTWFQDDETIAHFEKVNPNIKFIIAPHDITNQRLQNCLSLYKNAVLFSDYVKGFNTAPQNVNTLIIDNVGMLSKLYHYATITFIGGGFGADGIHNCLEAAVHYKPVLFGPVYDKYIEALGLVDAGGAISIEDALDFEAVANKLFSNEVDRIKMGQHAGDFVHAHKGASAKIIHYIQENRLLTS
ncbi:MAG: 3-deoxy-D-manno-octulosonic acid transferase [Sediminibacterium sp.]|nr:3-deoxy-D-manno-octulosonic acid transferase [Sediminibacterium sp.]